MKKNYEKPFLEMVEFDESDVVTNSCEIDTLCLNIDTPPQCLRNDN